jgi:hypothetical protein
VYGAQVQSYLDKAYGLEAVAAFQSDETRQNNLAMAYALYLVFDFVAMRMSAEPLTVSVTEKGSHGYSAEQIRQMSDRAQKYLSDYRAMLVLDPTQRPRQVPGAVSLPNTVVF